MADPAAVWDVEGPVQAELYVVWLEAGRIALTGPCGAGPGCWSWAGPTIRSRSSTASYATSSGRRCWSTRRRGDATETR